MDTFDPSSSLPTFPPSTFDEPKGPGRNKWAVLGLIVVLLILSVGLYRGLNGTTANSGDAYRPESPNRLIEN